MIQKQNIHQDPQRYQTSQYLEHDEYHTNSIDSVLFLMIILLLGSGLVFCFSAYYHFSSRHTSQIVLIHYFIGRQILWAVVGLLLMVFALRINLDFFYKITPFLWIITVILNFLPLTGLFGSIRGGSRWIHLGSVSFQPSELSKLTLVLYLTRVLYRWKNQVVLGHRIIFLKSLFMTFLLCLPIYLQNNLSTAIFLYGMSLLILFLAGAPLIFTIFQALTTIVISIISITSTWRIARLENFLNSNRDVLGIGMQSTMARRAVESGGFLGRGLGNGFFKMGRISMVHSDYIFSTVVEEIGVLGAIGILSLFLLFVIRAWSLVKDNTNLYEVVLMRSLSFVIIFQTLLHVSVVIGLLPVTGIPMPFFSAGGSSLATTLLMCGIMLNISRKKNYV